MTFIAILGWCGAVTSTFMLLPQAFALLRTRDTKGMSWPLWVVQIGTTVGWFMHGIKLGQAFMLMANTIAFTAVVIALIFLRRDKRLPTWWLVLPGLAFGALLAVLDRAVGSAAFGATVVTPIAIAKLYQAVTIMRDTKVTGVSTTSWVVQLANECIWLTWGLMYPDRGTIISAIVSLTCNVTVLTILLLRLRGVGPFFPRRDEPAPEQILAEF